MIRVILVALVTAVWMPLCTFLLLAARIVTGSPEASYGIFRLWARTTLAMLGVETRIVGEIRGSPRIYVGNHPTSWDPLVLMTVIPKRLAAVAKRQLAGIPFVGWTTWAAGWIFIDQGDHEAARASIASAADRIRSGLDVLIFPEGRRTENPAGLAELRKGSFHLALATGVPIQPFVVLGWERCMPRRRLLPRAGLLTIRFGEEIVIEEGETADSLLEKVRERMLSLFDKE